MTAYSLSSLTTTVGPRLRLWLCVTNKTRLLYACVQEPAALRRAVNPFSNRPNPPTRPSPNISRRSRALRPHHGQTASNVNAARRRLCEAARLRIGQRRSAETGAKQPPNQLRPPVDGGELFCPLVGPGVLKLAIAAPAKKPPTPELSPCSIISGEP